MVQPTSGWRRVWSLAFQTRESKITRLAEWGEKHWLGRLAWFLAVVWNQFVANRCLVRAAALAYATALSLVPLLAIVVSITTAFLRDDGAVQVERLIDRMVGTVAPALNLRESANQEEAQLGRAQLVEGLQTAIGQVESGALGVAAFATLAFIAISLLSTVEGTLNDIWAVQKPRSWLTRVVYYWAFLTLGPLLLFSALGLQFTGLHASIQEFELVRTILAFGLSLLLLCGICALLYYLLPNTRVDWRAALVGGLVAGFILQMNNQFSVLYISRALSYNKIYGSLSIVPIFLFGLYLSWAIVLCGAQVAACFQRRASLLAGWQTRPPGSHSKERHAVRLMAHIAADFHAEKEPPKARELAHVIARPEEYVQEILAVLVEAKLLRVTQGGPAYLPARPLESMTLHDVLQALREQPASSSGPPGPAEQAITAQLGSVASAEQGAAEKITLLSLAQQIGPSPAPSQQSENRPQSPNSEVDKG